MKLKKLAYAAAIACASFVGDSVAAETGQVRLVNCSTGTCSAPAAVPCGCGQPVCGCTTAPAAPSCAPTYTPSYASSCQAPRSRSCGGGCGGGCDLGDPWTLFGSHNDWTVGGWLQTGYHSAANSLFNSRADEFQVHQAWTYIEKTADGSNGLGIGGRFDAMYGTDSQDTQAFGADSGWDNGFDNGPDYGFALPQAYLDFAYGDMSVKVGHFYTIIGWEVVTAPDNFFYSHAYTMYNSEPFTHTGVLGTFNLTDSTSVWGGYTLGWDSGFNDNGDNFLGGISTALTENINLIYATTIGRFGEARFGGVEKGYMHSVIADVALTDSVQYIFQSDYLDTENGDDRVVRDTFGINQYLIKNFSDCFAVGARFEWWDNDSFDDTLARQADGEVFALTLGANYRPNANMILRPEVRWDWDNGDDLVAGLEDGDDEQFTFGMDTIFLF